MTAKEKSKELVNKYLQIYDGRVPQAKQCALICVDEIVQVLWHNHEKNSEKMYRYYIEVKKEIEKL
tara:strand:- start:1046 stop:1243 length:198 start_codon:yes stop_codon:yes gene_type:complete